eukprot:716788_1
MKLMRKQKREMMRIAKKNKLKELNRKLLKSDWKCLRLSKIYKGDYVLLKRTKSLSKRDASFDFGWFVLGVERNHDKEIYVIRNIFDNEELRVNKGRIRAFHRPLRADPIAMLRSDLIRIAELENAPLGVSEELKDDN